MDLKRLVELLVNRSVWTQEFYEENLSNVVPCYELDFSRAPREVTVERWIAAAAAGALFALLGTLLRRGRGLGRPPVHTIFAFALVWGGIGGPLRPPIDPVHAH